jgi:hypothetical protein
MQWDVCQDKMAPAAAELSCGVIAVTMRYFLLLQTLAVCTC